MDRRTYTERRPYNLQYYRRHYKRIRKYERERCRANARYLRRVRHRPCKDCDDSFPWYVMEFDHVRGKRWKCVPAMTSNSRQSIDAEIAKCDIVCANCHRKRTYRRKQQKQRKSTISAPKSLSR